MSDLHDRMQSWASSSHVGRSRELGDAWVESIRTRAARRRAARRGIAGGVGGVAAAGLVWVTLALGPVGANLPASGPGATPTVEASGVDGIPQYYGEVPTLHDDNIGLGSPSVVQPQNGVRYGCGQTYEPIAATGWTWASPDARVEGFALSGTMVQKGTGYVAAEVIGETVVVGPQDTAGPIQWSYLFGFQISADGVWVDRNHLVAQVVAVDADGTIVGIAGGSHRLEGADEVFPGGVVIPWDGDGVPWSESVGAHVISVAGYFSFNCGDFDSGTPGYQPCPPTAYCVPPAAPAGEYALHTVVQLVRDDTGEVVLTAVDAAGFAQTRVVLDADADMVEPGPQIMIDADGVAGAGPEQMAAVIVPEASPGCFPHQRVLGASRAVTGFDVTTAATSGLARYTWDGEGVVAINSPLAGEEATPWFLDREVYLVATNSPNSPPDYAATFTHVFGGEEGPYWLVSAASQEGRLDLPGADCVSTQIGWGPDFMTGVFLVVEGAPPGVDATSVIDGPVETWIYLGVWPLDSVA